MPSTYDFLKEDDYRYFVLKHSSMFKRYAEAYADKEREENKNESLRD